MDLRGLCGALQLGTGTAEILLHGRQVRAQLLSVSEQILNGFTTLGVPKTEAVG